MLIRETDSAIRQALIGAALLICIVFAVAVGWFSRGALSPADRPVLEASAPAVKQPDGSLLLERRPDASAVAPMQIPTGAKVERIAQVRIKSKPVTVQSSAPGALQVDCPPATLDLALVRQPDQSRRMIASSPDGVILGGVDIPVEPMPLVPDYKWAAGASYDDQRKSGIWIERDLSRLRAGVAVRQSDQGLRREVRLGWRF